MSTASSYKLRFYEQDPTVKFAVEFLFTFPRSVQSIIGKGFGQIAARDYRAQHMLNDVKSLGKETVLALYALQQKRRAYDKTPAIHQAMSYMMVLSSESRKSLALKLNGLTGLVYEYLRDCRVAGSIPQTELLEALTSLYVEEGNASAARFLKDLHASVLPVTLVSEEKPRLRELIREPQSGLRIREDLSGADV
jgi:hypothetical protein